MELPAAHMESKWSGESQDVKCCSSNGINPPEGNNTVRSCLSKDQFALSFHNHHLQQIQRNEPRHFHHSNNEIPLKLSSFQRCLKLFPSTDVVGPFHHCMSGNVATSSVILSSTQNRFPIQRCWGKTKASPYSTAHFNQHLSFHTHTHSIPSKCQAGMDRSKADLERVEAATLELFKSPLQLNPFVSFQHSIPESQERLSLIPMFAHGYWLVPIRSS